MIKHQQPGLRSSLYQPLSPEQVKKIEDACFEVLEKSGMAVYSKSAFEAFKSAGAICDAENQRVKMPRSFVEDCIASAPSSVTLHSRDDAFDCVLEKDRVHYGTGGTAIYVLDPKTGERRPSTRMDVALNARAVQKLENIHLLTINVFPTEIREKEDIDVNRFFYALDNTTKHVMGGIYTLEGMKKVTEMAEMMAGSPEALRNEPFISFITLIISPWKIDDIYGEMTCFAANKEIPVVVPTEPICGTTSPITLAGNVLTHMSETLGGICLTQAVKKGSPAICGSVGSITNLATMDHVAGAIERGIINAAVSQLSNHFEIPFYGTGGTSDSKEVDIQAAYESAMSALLVAMSGANYIHDIAGLMEFDLTVAYDKLAMDNEILGMCQRVLRGIEVDDETLGIDMILRKGPCGDYVSEGHTVEHMRGEFFQPKLANREQREMYTPSDSAAARAKRFVDELIAEKPTPQIEEKVRKQILERFPNIQPLEES